MLDVIKDVVTCLLVLKCVRIDELIESGRLSPFSPIALICNRLRVHWLPYIDGYIYGPSPGITEVLERILSLLKPNSMLDLFCGSGAFSKLAYLMNVKKIKAVDIYVEAARRNLKKLEGIEVEEGDALRIRSGRYDMVVADPPEEKIRELIDRLPELRRLYKDVAVVWVGPYHKAVEIIKTLSRDEKCIVVEAWGDAVAVFWKKKKHETIIERAIKNIG
ncbi:MAG: 50S ribosomal protein L11 methyltransferase [Thaumarchaeota archaeon]|nr:50S ribosomal protein L11 methyltransferase [Candidatus Geocrenenecus arthurdayi]MCL7396809.1 50S ribosomal protein L11 methyltransferase [Candidatus Geocrenenecus arthurdayi]MCL7403381.1 50S ribosomal protein L11 methyltransferase [Candidatus Geocrenenecus arthurdayi]